MYQPEQKTISGLALLPNRDNCFRNETKAMLLALEYPEPAKGGRGKTLEIFKGFDQGLLSKAPPLIIAHAPESVSRPGSDVGNFPTSFTAPSVARTARGTVEPSGPAPALAAPARDRSRRPLRQGRR